MTSKTRVQWEITRLSKKHVEWPLCFLGIKSPQRCCSGQEFARLKRTAANGPLSIPPLSAAERVLRLQLKGWNASLWRKKQVFQPPPAFIQQRWVCFHAFSCLSHMFLMLAASWSCCLLQDTCRDHLWCAKSIHKTQRLYQDGPLSLTPPACTLAVFPLSRFTPGAELSWAFSQHLALRGTLLKTGSEVLWKLKVV